MTIDANEVGAYLCFLRRNADLSLADIAAVSDISKPVLHRIETGERTATQSELGAILRAIGTEAAQAAPTLLVRKWLQLPRPSLLHPDQNLFWQAEQVVQEIGNFRAQPDIKSAFDQRLAEYEIEVRNAASLLMRRHFQLAFVGAIGLGKSTSICALTNLMVISEGQAKARPVLEEGSGGTTLCEVRIREGSKFSITIEARTVEEVRTDVQLFAQHYFPEEKEKRENDETEPVGLTREVTNAIRNMADLAKNRSKSADGTFVNTDPAKAMASQFANVREFTVQLLARMDLPRRDRRTMEFDENSSGYGALHWLRESFRAINRGLHPDFTLPKRIDITVQDLGLHHEGMELSIIDTRGMDKLSPRADIDAHLQDPHTLTLVCSSFNDAPSGEPVLLLERARDAEFSGLQENTLLFVLAKNSEALDVKDGQGLGVESAEEGYLVKGDEVERQLKNVGLPSLPYLFFNSRVDDPEGLRRHISGRFEVIRQRLRSKLEVAVNNAKHALDNYEKEQVQAAIQEAGRQIHTWLSMNRDVVVSQNLHVEKPLLRQIEVSHPSTIRATVARSGDWENLKYSHHLGFGARRMASRTLEKHVQAFSSHCDVASTQHPEAQELCAQANRLMQSSYEKLLKKMELMGETAFGDSIRTDQNFWRRCRAEWGDGYRKAIEHHNKEWFQEEARLAAEEEMREMLGREWEKLILRIDALVVGA